MALDEHGSGSRPDLIVEVQHAVENAELESSVDVVMVESKIGSVEGEDQLIRYAGHLSDMSGTKKSLVYMTRAYDPKGKKEILSSIDENICFEQLRWHDFYRFLQTVERDALVEEVRSELESFAGNKIRREPSVMQIRRDEGYFVYAPLTHGGDLLCYVGYAMNAPDEYPTIQVDLSVKPGSSGRQQSVAAMRRIAQHADWQPYDLDDPDNWSGVWRESSLSTLLSEEDHVAAVKQFFIDSIRRLRDDLTAFKKEHPDLPWTGGKVPPGER